MYFKLSLKNIKKSCKDYAIYFITLVLGVAIFYMFNSLDSQEAMLQVSNSTKQMIQLMIEMLNFVSVFIAVILGFLIVYANNFLINRRKREFGIYMTLGMGKRQISKILFFETIFVGIFSLIIGLILGIFASQFMSVLVAKLFQADMTKFEFVFSQNACIKTGIYFAIMYLAVMIFNTITISRYKLIQLLTAIKKNETIKIKNPFLCMVIFALAVGILQYCYHKVTKEANTLITGEKILPIILFGIVATILLFWSFSGFILTVVQMRKKIYLKGTNLFVLRQLQNKINTMVVSISVICLMLFMTISVLSSALSLRNSMEKDLLEMTPVDLNLYKIVNLPKSSTTRQGKVIEYTEEQRRDSRQTIQETLIQNGYDIKQLKDIVEIPIYVTDTLTWKDTLASVYEEVKQEFPGLKYQTPEEIVKISDYNKIARLYGLQEYTIEEGQYILLCDFDNMVKLRNQALKKDSTITIQDKKYSSKYDQCQKGYIRMSTSHVNTGIILVPDSCKLTQEHKKETFLAANYNANTQEEREEIEKSLTSSESNFIQQLAKEGIQIDGMTKDTIIESSVGLATIVVFIAIYLGIIFLIASSAILALKQLTESSDNRQRYILLRKIGCEERMIHQALFRQIGIFFLLPLLVAMIHSIFGIQFVITLMSGLASKEQLLPSAIATVLMIGMVYGIYFCATYFGSKNIIKEE